MKKQAFQIIQKLQVYSSSEVLKAFELYKEALENNQNLIKEKLIKDGWVSSEVKPEKGTPFYFIDNLYWTLTEKARQRKIEEIKASKKPEAKKKARIKTKSKTYRGTSVTRLKCPDCGSKLYKESVCPKCKEGRKGFRVRLICEDNPDHEILI